MLALATPQRPRSNVQSHDLAAELSALVPDLETRALRLCRSQALAEDLVQDTLLRAMRFQEQFIRGTNLRAWANQILFSVFITKCRRARRERNAIAWLTSDPNAWTKPEPTTAMAGLTPTVRRALDALPRGFRDVVLLVDIEEMPYKQAAEQLNVPVGTVMSRLFRARRALAESLGGTRGEQQQAAA